MDAAVICLRRLGLLLNQVHAGFGGLAAELACGAGMFDQPAQLLQVLLAARVDDSGFRRGSFGRLGGGHVSSSGETDAARLMELAGIDVLDGGPDFLDYAGVFVAHRGGLCYWVGAAPAPQV